ncbi:hypothetical protein AWN90_25380 [Nocardia terpenica]|uniref:Uncharacterized protein n=2 Tax=Nocardia terpenica TaxID=455432 RepID=A0A164NIR3_9NOCA|nr:hypothetical protein AWN90_25380 [Nocardia terpenica]
MLLANAIDCATGPNRYACRVDSTVVCIGAGDRMLCMTPPASLRNLNVNLLSISGWTEQEDRGDAVTQVFA